MKRVAAIVLATAMVLPVLTGCGAVIENQPTTSETTVQDNKPLRAQDDYFRFVNQDRFNTSEFKYGEPTVEVAFKTDLIDDQIEKIIDDCVAGSGYKKGSEEEVIQRAYKMFQAYDFEKEKIPQDLMDMIEAVDKAGSVRELLQLDARLKKEYGVGGIISISTSINPFKPTERVMNISQLSGVLSVSFTTMRDSNNAAFSIKRDAEVVLSTRGYDKETGDKYGKALAMLALDIYAETDLDITEDPMVFKYQKIIGSDEAKKLLSNVDLDSYLAGMGIDKNAAKKYCITDENQLKALNKVLTEDNLEALKAWELGEIYKSYMRYIAPHYDLLASYKGRNYESEHDQAINEIKATFYNETDPIYVERHYSAETDEALRKMCDDIKDGYRKIIKNASWLSDATRAELLKKLENIIYLTGSDLKRHDPSEYSDITGNNYYELCRDYQRHSYNKSVEKFNKNTPVSRTEINMPMQMMNACYDSSSNTITITSAITNDPFFNAKADYFTNLGGLGAVIAHEMGHAFDSNCILFNSKGEYDPSWINESDLKTLEARNEKAAKYFEDNFKVFGYYHVDGEQTLGENYADLGGVECIVSLCKTKEDRIKLFENYAKIWCEMRTDEAIIDQIAYDVHSPSYIRVNAILSSIDAFYETYDVKEGDGMYIAPEKRISRWY